MFTVVLSFSLLMVELQNLFKCKQSILGYLNMVICFSILSTPLHFEHLYPHLSIASGQIYPFINSLTSIQPVYLMAFLGKLTLKSIKLSKVQLLNPQLLQIIELQSCPSNKSVIIELSQPRLYCAQISDYLLISSFSHSISLYFGLEVTLLSSLCIPSNRHLNSSYASCQPYPLNQRETRLKLFFKSVGLTDPPVLTLLESFSKFRYASEILVDLLCLSD